MGRMQLISRKWLSGWYEKTVVGDPMLQIIGIRVKELPDHVYRRLTERNYCNLEVQNVNIAYLATKLDIASSTLRLWICAYHEGQLFLHHNQSVSSTTLAPHIEGDLFDAEYFSRINVADEAFAFYEEAYLLRKVTRELNRDLIQSKEADWEARADLTRQLTATRNLSHSLRQTNIRLSAENTRLRADDAAFQHCANISRGEAGEAFLQNKNVSNASEAGARRPHDQHLMCVVGGLCALSLVLLIALIVTCRRLSFSKKKHNITFKEFGTKL